MARNIEIKVRIPSVEALLGPARALADGPPTEILQDDTFFACRDGRLKLRVLGDGSGQLIHYRRPDTPGPRQSDYTIFETPAPAALRDALAQALGVTGRVVKRRLLLLCGQTRIHLDRVTGLGDFLELEVVLREGQSAAQGAAIAEGLCARLGLDPDARSAGAYRDLLAAAGTTP